MYWRHYYDLERDFFSLERVVALRDENSCTTGRSISDLHVVVCGAFEGVIQATRLLVGIEAHKPTSIPDLIRKYCTKFPGLYGHEIIVGSDEEPYARHPFAGRDSKNGPNWWQSYNQYKHDRYERMFGVTFGHLLDAILATYTINVIRCISMRAEIQLATQTKLAHRSALVCQRFHSDFAFESPYYVNMSELRGRDDEECPTR